MPEPLVPMLEPLVPEGEVAEFVLPPLWPAPVEPLVPLLPLAPVPLLPLAPVPPVPLLPLAPVPPEPALPPLPLPDPDCAYATDIAVANAVSTAKDLRVPFIVLS